MRRAAPLVPLALLLHVRGLGGLRLLDQTAGQARAGVVKTEDYGASEDVSPLWEPVPPRFWGYDVRRPAGSGHESEVSLRRHPLQPTLVPPSAPQELNLVHPWLRSYSQVWQDTILWQILSQVKDGFFVESGAEDGERNSNTIAFERSGWNGLLVEPSNVEFPRLQAKRRHAYLFHGCLSPTGRWEELHFHNRADGFSHIDESGSATVKAAPLQGLMEAVGRSTVDFWSLDIEGSEPAVLRHTDFSKLEVGLILVESMHWSEPDAEETLRMMRGNGFQVIGRTRHPFGYLDYILANTRYFERRGLRMPKSLEYTANSKRSTWSWKY